MSDSVRIDKNILMIVGLVVILAVGAFYLTSQKTIPQSQNTSQLQNQTGAQNNSGALTNNTTFVAANTTLNVPNQVSIPTLINGSMKMGSDNSTLVMVEFADLQCPFCRKFWYQSLANIRKEYIDNGKVQFIYRNLPLDVYPMSEPSAEALLCAKEQGKEWELHDKIYLEQIKIGALGLVRYGSYELLKWANETGLDMIPFQTCLSSQKYQAVIQNDKDYAKSLGFTNTPSFIIARRDGSDWVPIIGTQKYDTYNSTINNLLR